MDNYLCTVRLQKIFDKIPDKTLDNKMDREAIAHAIDNLDFVSKRLKEKLMELKQLADQYEKMF